MGLGYVFSCGTRLYDLSPSQLARLKEDRKAKDEEKHKISDQMEAIKKRIAKHWDEVKDVEEKVTELRRTELRGELTKLMSNSAANTDRPRTELIDEAEHKLPPAAADSPLGKLEAIHVSLHQGDAEAVALESQAAALHAKLRTFIDVKLAPSPVIPPQQAWNGRTWKTLLAEPPFVRPPADDPRVDSPPYDMHRYWNYWMMTQRGGALVSHVLRGVFAVGVCLVLLLSDMWGIRVGVFRTFGTNALAAYILEGLIGSAVKDFIPHDAPQWYTIGGFCVFFFLVWLFVRTMEKNKIYLRV